MFHQFPGPRQSHAWVASFQFKIHGLSFCRKRKLSEPPPALAVPTTFFVFFVSVLYTRLAARRSSKAWRSHEGQNPPNLISGQNPTRNQCEPSLVSCFLQRFQPNVFIAGLPCSKRDRLYTVDISNSKRDRQGHEGPASVVSALPSQRGTHSSVPQSLSVCAAAFACTALGRDWLRSLRS